jgi:hypothetical protein
MHVCMYLIYLCVNMHVCMYLINVTSDGTILGPQAFRAKNLHPGTRYVYTCIYICMYAYIYKTIIYTYMYLCMHVYIYSCIFIYVNINQRRYL